MSEHPVGRHRPAARYSPLAELSFIVRTAGENGVRASAVLAASGGLVAAVALPAQAARLGTETQAAPAPAQAAGSPRALVAAPALVAPTAAAPVRAETVGVDGVTAVAKPKPKPVERAVEQRADAGASRSATRTPTVTVPPAATGVVGIARSLLGIPYVYGGTSPSSGFDCSGFTSYVFAQAGTSLPRTAAQQQAAATPVSNPQPGDLVFFGSPAWHVGIYTGNGMMVHSGKPGEVTEESPLFSGVSGYGRF
ncbi:C40 family peptidase [uncultured Phycicoccus sp.]|uniref:C40 family peptidase n=1 Tax=uncultured Phycicoccus sp. TaxID=661422 RepID=UPI002606BA9B|nr:C40 family peptidase [uncultured Phycicoccus sp.]